MIPRRSLLLTALLTSLAAPALGQAALAIGFLGRTPPSHRRASPLAEPAAEEGLAGARLAITEANGTGRFAGQVYRLLPLVLEPGADPAEAARRLAAAGAGFLVADLPAEMLVAAASAFPGPVLNAGAPDDALRNALCRRNLLHTAPSRAMLADALAQYLAWKRWTRWFLVPGPEPGDTLLAEALRRAAERFGASIVAERPWRFRFGSGRADTGHVTLQSEIPAFTRGVRDHDVLLVADEADAFGEWLEGRTERPRPVAGTHGIIAAAWSPVTEAWGGVQLQNRFRAATGRRMTALDYCCWLAVRAVAEAALRGGSMAPDAVAAFMRGPDFLLAGFKGQGMSFRDWDGQLRQPILICGPRLLISASPQPGFLHRVTPLDTLGQDRAESGCRT